MKGDLFQALQTSMIPMEFKTGEAIALDIAGTNLLYYIESGAALLESAPVETLPNDVNPQNLKSVGVLRTAGTFVGLEYLFMSDPTTCRTSITGLYPGVLWTIPQETLKQLLHGDLHKLRGALVEVMATHLADAHSELFTRLDGLAKQDQQTQILSTLQHLAELFGTAAGRGVLVPIKINLLARLTGLSEFSARRTVTKLLDAEVIARAARGSFLIYH